MDKHALLRSLNSQISDLEKMVKDMAQSSSIHQLDKDMFKNKIRILYEDALRLQKVDLQGSPSSDERPPELFKESGQAKNLVADPMPEQKSTPAPEPETKPSPEPEHKTPENPKTKAEVQPENIIKTSPHNSDNKPLEKREPVPRPASRQQAPLFEPIPIKGEKTAPPPSASSSSIQKPRSDASSLGERLKPQKEAVNEIYGKAQATKKNTANPQPVSDILVAIGLNDRFLFTRELFRNDSELFKITVSQLNNMASFDAAKTYLSTQFNWDQENPTTEMFMQIVKRRYL
jgi:hypothetical protein